MVPHGFREFAQRFSHAENDGGKRELNAGPTTFGYCWLLLMIFDFFWFCKWFRTDSMNSRSVFPMRKLTAASANSTLARRRLIIFGYFYLFLFFLGSVNGSARIP